MLEYENQMLLDSLHEDGLTISAKGLSLDTVFLNIVKVYCDPGNLVFVLGTDRKEEQLIINELQIQDVTPLPRIITSENSVTERENIYAEGGVLFISSRIIVVDLLKKRVPVQHITGFLVCRAHKILESCQDGFALRLYRLENKTGFIKAFSTSAVAFTRGFARVERIMKTLFVRNLYLWPRFHAVVNSTLQKKKPEVIELHLELTQSMLQIQTALFDLVAFVVKEIKRINPSLDMEEVTVENSLLRSFQKVMNLQLDPVWHQLSPTTKQLVSDLKILRHLLLSLTQLDSVRFANVLSAFRTTEYVHRSSGWVLMDAAETLFVTANKRLYNFNEDVAPEENPKWKALSEVLKEIRTSSKEPETVLVLVNHIETCKQIKQYLMKGSTDLLSELYKRYIGSKSIGNKPEIFTEEEIHSDDESFALSQKLDTSTGNTEFEEISKDRVGVEPVVVLQPFKHVDPLPDVLKNLKPKYVVMYDVDMTAIRQIEVYQCKHLEFKIRVYFLMYTAAIDEQAYLSTLRSEKNAFDFLIKEKSTMAVPVEQDGKSGDCPELWRDCPKGESSSRKGGVTSVESNPVVIVDMREFRSELPVLLHRRGIDIVPVTLEVGDYILSPEMCVERKSINDLIGSLNSGRLYQQALSMVRHYSKPMLLIEFDQNKPFDFQGRYYLSKDINSNDITNKLQLLTIHFPKLRIVWSASPYATAQLILELKEGREEPKYDIAAAVGQDESTNDFEKYNAVVKDFISKLPGVTTHNITALLNNINSLTQLATLTQDQINIILKHPSNAELLYNALHKDYQASVKQTSSTRIKSRGFRAINKKKKQ